MMGVEEAMAIAANYEAGVASGMLIPSRDGDLADFLAVSGADASMSINERVAQLSQLPINGGKGLTVTTTGPGMGISIPPGAAAGAGDILKRALGSVGQGLINQGVESASDWLKRQFGTAGYSEDKPQGGVVGPPRIGTKMPIGGQGGIDLPIGGMQGAGGVVYQPGKGLVLRQSYTGTWTRDRRVKFDAYGNIVLRPRRMNVLNPHALSRAFRRTQGFAHVAKAALSAFGLHVSGKPRMKGKKKSSRFGRR